MKTQSCRVVLWECMKSCRHTAGPQLDRSSWERGQCSLGQGLSHTALGWHNFGQDHPPLHLEHGQELGRCFPKVILSSQVLLTASILISLSDKEAPALSKIGPWSTYVPSGACLRAPLLLGAGPYNVLVFIFPPWLLHRQLLGLIIAIPQFPTAVYTL